MCGVAGMLRFDQQPIEPARLRAMEEAIACRGPDDRGTFVDGRCGLVHARLAIIDKASGAQPMRRGELTVVYNGEIYNHRDLRRQLESLGHRFTSDHSDTEVLLHGYKQWGTMLPRHLHGMFAFVIWDAAERTLFAARDRIGKKPLYFHRSGGEMVFASSVAGVAGGVGALPLNREALGHYLTFGYFDTASIFEGVSELPAGHWMTVSPSGPSRIYPYWQPPPISATRTSVGVADVLRQMIDDAVRARLEADVELGCFLSGGIDSTLIACLAQEHMRRQTRRLKTFTVAMPDARYDEGPAARATAEAIGSEHVELVAEPHVEDDLLTLTREMGEPLADSSILPTYWISRAAKQHVTVALSGDGGDELFGGYSRYRAMLLIRRYRALLNCVPAGLFAAGETKSPTARVRRLIEAASFEHPAQQYLSIVRLFTPGQLRQLGLGDLAVSQMPSWPDAVDPAEAAKRWDLLRYLPFDLLRKVDRASMAVGLEVRCPMLDSAVVDLAAHLPSAVIMPRGRTKALLRRIAAPLVPPEVLKRKKSGFAVPISAWFRSTLRSMLMRWLLEHRGLTDLGVDRRGLESLIQQHMRGKVDHGHRLFALLGLAMWTEQR
jgi:asparagine synthase (glutamine-hydrolysing)